MATRSETRVAREQRAPRDIHLRQRDEFGGLNWGAAFFGWLVAIGVATLLTAILSAAGAAIGLTKTSPSQASGSADTIGIVGGILLIAVLAIAYWCGGYVSGRMSRFDGGRQGLGAWIIGLLVTILAAVIGWAFGAKYNVLDRVNLPDISFPEDAGIGAIIAGVVLLVVTALTAMAGGKAGRHYHAKVDATRYPE